MPSGKSVIEARAGGTTFTLTATGLAEHELPLGKLRVEKPGYVRVDLQGLSRTGPNFAELSHLVLATATPGVVVEYVRNNNGNMFGPPGKIWR